MRIYETVTVADLQPRDLILTGDGWQTVTRVEDHPGGEERSLWLGAKSSPVRRDTAAPVQRHVGAVRTDLGRGDLRGYAPVERLYEALLGQDPKRLWDVLTRTLNALEKAGESPVLASLDGRTRVKGQTGAAEWDADASTWRTTELY